MNAVRKEYPEIVSPADAQGLRVLSEEGNWFDRDWFSFSPFSVGVEVRIFEGGFASFEGVIESLDMNVGKVVVLVAIFGRETPVELELQYIEKA